MAARAPSSGSQWNPLDLDPASSRIIGDVDTYLTIGEFARQTGLTERALRIYDLRGLLPPAAVDPSNGYRLYADHQLDDGRMIAMLRSIDMPLADIEKVMEAPLAERSAAVGRYWYRVEEGMHQYRNTVGQLRGFAHTKEHGMSHADSALDRGRTEGAFATIAELAAIEDPLAAADAYSEAMRTAYWNDKDVPLTTAIAYAGVSRLLTEAQRSDDATATELRSRAKAMTYNLASFTWTGWDEPGIDVAPSDRAAGLAAARSNLDMAVELDTGDLAISRGWWMLGAHLLTGGDHSAACEAFAAAAEYADRAGSEVEAELSRAFDALASLAGGDEDAETELTGALGRLRAMDGGDGFVSQVETCRSVLDL